MRFVLLRLITLFVLLSVSIGSYSKSVYAEALFQAYLSSSMDSWKGIIDEMQNNKLNQTNIEFTAELVNYQYGYIAYHLGEHTDKDLAEEYLDIAEVNLAWLESRNFDESLTSSYRAAFYGFRIGVNNLYVSIHGFKPNSNAENALKLNPDNPFAYVQMANVRYYQPAFLGGSKTEALEYFLEAERIYLKEDTEQLRTNWVYLNLLATLGLSYSGFGEFEKAKEYYLKVLALQPNYLWVKNDLYPNITKKIENQKIDSTN